MPTKQPDLAQVRQRLVARRHDLTHRQRLVESDLRRDNEALVADSGDQAIQRENDEALEAVGAAARTEIAAIDAALERLKGGRYGICQRCAGAIQAARLDAVPYAVTCARCASD